MGKDCSPICYVCQERFNSPLSPIPYVPLEGPIWSLNLSWWVGIVELRRVHVPYPQKVVRPPEPTPTIFETEVGQEPYYRSCKAHHSLWAEEKSLRSGSRSGRRYGRSLTVSDGPCGTLVPVPLEEPQVAKQRDWRREERIGFIAGSKKREEVQFHGLICCGDIESH